MGSYMLELFPDDQLIGGKLSELLRGFDISEMTQEKAEKMLIGVPVENNQEDVIGKIVKVDLEKDFFYFRLL